MRSGQFRIATRGPMSGLKGTEGEAKTGTEGGADLEASYQAKDPIAWIVPNIQNINSMFIDIILRQYTSIVMELEGILYIQYTWIRIYYASVVMKQKQLSYSMADIKNKPGLYLQIAMSQGYTLIQYTPRSSYPIFSTNCRLDCSLAYLAHSPSISPTTCSICHTELCLYRDQVMRQFDSPVRIDLHSHRFCSLPVTMNKWQDIEAVRMNKDKAKDRLEMSHFQYYKAMTELQQNRRQLLKVIKMNNFISKQDNNNEGNYNVEESQPQCNDIDQLQQCLTNFYEYGLMPNPTKRSYWADQKQPNNGACFSLLQCNRIPEQSQSQSQGESYNMRELVMIVNDDRMFVLQRTGNELINHIVDCEFQCQHAVVASVINQKVVVTIYQLLTPHPTPHPTSTFASTQAIPVLHQINLQLPSQANNNIFLKLRNQCLQICCISQTKLQMYIIQNIMCEKIQPKLKLDYQYKQLQSEENNRIFSVTGRYLFAWDYQYEGNCSESYCNEQSMVCGLLTITKSQIKIRQISFNPKTNSNKIKTNKIANKYNLSTIHGHTFNSKTKTNKVYLYSYQNQDQNQNQENAGLVFVIIDMNTLDMVVNMISYDNFISQQCYFGIEEQSQQGESEVQIDRCKQLEKCNRIMYKQLNRKVELNGVMITSHRIMKHQISIIKSCLV